MNILLMTPGLDTLLDGARISRDRHQDWKVQWTTVHITACWDSCSSVPHAPHHSGSESGQCMCGKFPYVMLLLGSRPLLQN